MLRRLDSADAGFDAALDELLAWEAREADGVAQKAARIIDEVRAEGDAALLRFTATLDGVRAESAAELEIDAGNSKAVSRRCPGTTRKRCKPRRRAFDATTSTSRPADSSCATSSATGSASG